MTSPLIAILFEYATLNGGERSMLAALDWLRKNDSRFEFAAIAPSDGRLVDALRERGIPIRGWSPRDASGHRRSAEEIQSSLKDAVESLQPQLLHANSLAMGRLTGRLAADIEIPTTTHLRDIVKLSAGAIADLNGNRRLIAVSNATRTFHVEQGIDSARADVIHNGIDTELFQPRAATGWLHAELGLPFEIDDSNLGDETPGIRSTIPRARLIATIGQIGLRKGQDVLAAAAPHIVAQVPHAHFLLIGERTSMKMESITFEKSLGQKFADAGLSDRLHILGNRDDVSQLLNEIDLLVHPAYQEPFGRVLLEASAAGVPIVATNVGGTTEIVLHESTGLLVPSGDSLALATAAVGILTNESKALTFRNAARARIVREFPISSAAKRLGDFWSKILESN